MKPIKLSKSPSPHPEAESSMHNNPQAHDNPETDAVNNGKGYEKEDIADDDDEYDSVTAAFYRRHLKHGKRIQVLGEEEEVEAVRAEWEKGQGAMTLRWKQEQRRNAQIQRQVI
jgi:hypothetical protein